MRYDDFLEHVRTFAGLTSFEQAERTSQAVLETLGDRLALAVRDRLAGQLPDGIRQMLLGYRDAEAFGPEEFYRRVSARAAIDFPYAVDRTRAVMETLREAVPPAEFEGLLSALPREYGPLLGKSPIRSRPGGT